MKFGSGQVLLSVESQIITSYQKVMEVQRNRDFYFYDTILKKNLTTIALFRTFSKGLGGYQIFE